MPGVFFIMGSYTEILWLTELTITSMSVSCFSLEVKPRMSIISSSEMVKESPVVAPWVGAMEIMSMLMPHLEISSSTLAMEATLAGNSCNVTNVMLSTVLITVVALIAIPPQIKWDMSYSPGPI